MKPKLTTRIASLAFTLLLMSALAPAPAFAHDAIGGDELAVANWMLIGAVLTIVLGLFAGYWAWRNGQFSNIEESKYNMLELSDDYDQMLAEDDAARAQSEKSETASART